MTSQHPGEPGEPADPTGPVAADADLEAADADLEAADDFDDEDDDFDDDDEQDAADPFAALSALFGGGVGGGANPLAGLLEQAQHLQADLQDAQRRLADQLVTGTSGGGLVRATVTGDGELRALRIDPSVVDPTDVDTLADLVIAAVRAATSEAKILGERAMAGAVPDFSGIPGPGAVPGFGAVPDFGAVPGLGPLPAFGTFPGIGPLDAPAGDDPDDDDIGPSGTPRV